MSDDLLQRRAVRMKKQSEAYHRAFVAELMLRQWLSLLDRLDEGSFVEATAVKAVLEVFDNRPADLVAVATRINDELSRFRAPCDHRERAVFLAAWALVEDAHTLEREATADFDDLAAAWAKWSRERDFNVGGPATKAPNEQGAAA